MCRSYCYPPYNPSQCRSSGFGFFTARGGGRRHLRDVAALGRRGGRVEGGPAPPRQHGGPLLARPGRRRERRRPEVLRLRGPPWQGHVAAVGGDIGTPPSEPASARSWLEREREPPATT